ncbi:hypothetical protein SAR116_2055 [Candidatus Puniceispirillum marinum IMCC1322]|uniref:Uncharacterized protein n=1 Tax=Puniceispirillum marinum (strain IMCC1322) TaxID=488538 RepID=D5BNA5_PUNMI|nr:hypothetical protein SAR116_2055 [Candidatus Puniceispirillum marinum IMCC1322]
MALDSTLFVWWMPDDRVVKGANIHAVNDRCDPFWFAMCDMAGGFDPDYCG